MTCSSVAAEKLIIRRVLLSPGQVLFVWRPTFGSHQSRGNSCTFYKIEFFLLDVLALPEHVFDETSSEDSLDTDVNRVRLGVDQTPALEVYPLVTFMMTSLRKLEDYCLYHVHEIFTI